MSNTRNWRFNFQTLKVIKAQEDALLSDGDEPYFVFFGVRSKYQVPDSTQVFLNDYFDEEWAEGIDAEETKSIPTEMGLLTFPDVNVLNISDVINGQLPEFLGFIGVAIESDATPFGEIEGLMNQVRNATFNEIKRLIEDGKLNITNPAQDIQKATQTVQNSLELTVGDKIRIFFASFTDPDDLIGVRNQFLIAGDSSLKSFFSQQDSPIELLEPKSLQLNFEGDGAHYQVDGVLETFNIAPTALVSGDIFGVPGMLRSFSLSATDPSIADTTAGFTFNVDFEDGTRQVILPTDLQTITHVYTTEGTKTLTVTATDREGGVSETAVHTIDIKAAGIFPDPTNSAQTDLFIGGTVGNDTIKVNQQGKSNFYDVVISDQSKGTFAPTERIVIYGQTGNDVIDTTNSNLPVDIYSAEGNDSLYGGNDSDRLYGDADNDTLYANNGDDILYGGTGVDFLFGEVGKDTLYGESGDDILDGGLGDDSMFGGKDNDQYYVDSINDTVTEYANEGIDRVFSSATYTLRDNVENLTLTGNSIINGTGNSLYNTITGNESDNYLYGLDGNDTLIGGGGSDILDGGLGVDSLFGGQGNDNYYVDNINDIITEYANQGNDNVFSSVTYKLDDNLENLTLTGNSIINGTGNSLGNIITGNDAGNTLDGKAGNDFLYGNAGNDTILGDDGDDKLIGGLGADILNGGNGIDFASYLTATNGVTASLNASQNNTGDAQGDIYQFMENLEGSEFGDSLFGDNQNNSLWGLGGDDILNGFAGADFMQGGFGNDTYFVDDAGDNVSEFFDQGNQDLVNSAINYILGSSSNLENLNLLEGTAALNGTGNELNNIINGNSANNFIDGGTGNDSLFGFAGGDTLIGGDGSDWLTGGQGNDILTGGNRNDYFAYSSITDAGDRITDFTVGSDKIVLTEVVNSSGFRSFNPLADGFFSVRSAGTSMAAIMIDPDGAAGGSFRPAPFLLLNNVSASALNNSSNFVF